MKRRNAKLHFQMTFSLPSTSCLRKLPIITSADVIIAGGEIFKMAASRFVDVSEEKINLMKENAIPRNTKHATKFGITVFKGKM